MMRSGGMLERVLDEHSPHLLYSLHLPDLPVLLVNDKAKEMSP